MDTNTSGISLTNAALNNGTTCSPLVDEYFLTKMIIPTAVAVIVVLVLLENKVDSASEKRHCCGRRPGRPVPVNLLDGHENRFPYALAFGCTSTSVFGNVLQFTDIHGPGGLQVPGYLFYLYVLLLALIIGFTYYPLFVCLSGNCAVLHPLIGFGYSAMWFFFQLSVLFPCPDFDTVVLKVYNIIIALPSLTCLLCLLGVFLHMFVKDIRCLYNLHAGCKGNDSLLTGRGNGRERLARPHHLLHVRQLLDGYQESLSSSDDLKNPSLIHKIKLTYKGQESFKYSPRIISTFFIAGLCMFQVVGLFLYTTIQISVSLEPSLKDFKTAFNLSSLVYKHIEIFCDTALVCNYIAFSVTTAAIVAYFFQAFYSYRKNICLLYKGDFTNIPDNVLKQSPTEILTSNIHYSGTHIAYLIWGYILQYIVIFVSTLLIAYIVILPFVGVVPEVFNVSFYTLLSAFVINLLFHYGQLLFSRRLLQPERVYNPITQETELVLAIKNRKLYHNMSYVLFFFYILLGFYRCFVRILKAIFLGVLYFGRLDKSTLVHGYETWDTGYMAYVNFLRVELVHCHPVMVVFCDLLLERVDRNRVKQMYGTEVNLIPATEQRGHRETPQTINVRIYDRLIQNKWLKAYTLLKNSSLRKPNDELNKETI